MTQKTGGKNTENTGGDGDWLVDLDRRLENIARMKKTDMTARGVSGRARLMEKVMEIFFGLWLKFDLDRGIRMRLTPFEWEYVEYRGKKDWRLNPDFNFEKVSDVELLDTTFPHAQGLRAEIYTQGGEDRIRVMFLLEDWRDRNRRGFTPYLIYDAPVDGARISDVWKSIRKTVMPWNEAHIRGDNELFWDWIKENYIALPRIPFEEEETRKHPDAL